MYSSFKLKYVLKASQNEDEKHSLHSLLSIALCITITIPPSTYHEAVCKTCNNNDNNNHYHNQLIKTTINDNFYIALLIYYINKLYICVLSDLAFELKCNAFQM